MPADRNEVTVFDKDFPTVRLILEVKADVSSPPEEDATVRQLIRSVWGANCHFGLVMTPTNTYVFRDDFTVPSLQAIRVTDVLPTGKLLRGLSGPSAVPVSERELQWLAREWLKRLAASYDRVLPEDPEVMRAFFPDIVSAVAEGRVVGEAA